MLSNGSARRAASATREKTSLRLKLSATARAIAERAGATPSPRDPRTDTGGAAAASTRVILVTVAIPEPSCHFRQLRIEAVEILLVRFRRKPVDVVALRDRREEHAPRDPGLSGFVGEIGGHLIFRERDVTEHDPLGRHLDEDALVGIAASVRSAHDEPPRAPRPGLEFFKLVREALRPPPARQDLRLRPRPEHAPTRRVDDTPRDDLPIGRGRNGCRRVGAHTATSTSSGATFSPFSRESSFVRLRASRT